MAVCSCSSATDRAQSEVRVPSPRHQPVRCRCKCRSCNWEITPTDADRSGLLGWLLWRPWWPYVDGSFIAPNCRSRTAVDIQPTATDGRSASLGKLSVCRLGAIRCRHRRCQPRVGDYTTLSLSATLPGCSATLHERVLHATVLVFMTTTTLRSSVAMGTDCTPNHGVRAL